MPLGRVRGHPAARPPHDTSQALVSLIDIFNRWPAIWPVVHSEHAMSFVQCANITAIGANPERDLKRSRIPAHQGLTTTRPQVAVVVELPCAGGRIDEPGKVHRRFVVPILTLPNPA